MCSEVLMEGRPHQGYLEHKPFFLSLVLRYCIAHNLNYTWKIREGLAKKISFIVTTNMCVTTFLSRFNNKYLIFTLLQRLCVWTILLPQIHVVTISLQHIACNIVTIGYFYCNTPPGAKLGLCRRTIYSKLSTLDHNLFQIFLRESKFFFEHQIFLSVTVTVSVSVTVGVLNGK